MGVAPVDFALHSPRRLRLQTSSRTSQPLAVSPDASSSRPTPSQSRSAIPLRSTARSSDQRRKVHHEAPDRIGSSSRRWACPSWAASQLDIHFAGRGWRATPKEGVSILDGCTIVRTLINRAEARVPRVRGPFSRLRQRRHRHVACRPSRVTSRSTPSPAGASTSTWTSLRAMAARSRRPHSRRRRAPRPAWA